MLLWFCFVSSFVWNGWRLCISFPVNACLCLHGNRAVIVEQSISTRDLMLRKLCSALLFWGFLHEDMETNWRSSTTKLLPGGPWSKKSTDVAKWDKYLKTLIFSPALDHPIWKKVKTTWVALADGKLDSSECEIWEKRDDAEVQRSQK